MARFLSANDFLELGLVHVGFDKRRCAATDYRRFRAHFGANPASCSATFSDLQTTLIEEARINKPNPVCFLMALNWFTTYHLEEELAGTWKKAHTTAASRATRDQRRVRGLSSWCFPQTYPSGGPKSHWNPLLVGEEKTAEASISCCRLDIK